MVGGRDFDADEQNLALGKTAFGLDWGGSGRGAGSSFKPFVLAEAIRQGISLNSKFNAPGQMTFPGVPGAEPGKDWEVGNYGGTEQGVLDIVDATRVSSNTAYAQLMIEVGPAERGQPGRAAGHQRASCRSWSRWCWAAATCRPLDMAVGYSTFANRGVHNDPVMITKIEQVDEDGDVNVIDQAIPSGERVLTEEEADLVTLLPAAGGAGRHRHARPTSGSRWRARPAPRRTTRTPGSSATRRSSRRRCGWGTPTRCPTAPCPPWTPTRR